MDLTVIEKGITSDELAHFLVPQRINDPLGLGKNRPVAPNDPDVYNIKREDSEYVRSLLKKDEYDKINKDIKKNGYLTIEQIRRIIIDNTIKDLETYKCLSPELIATIDIHINYKIFIVGDNVYSREELYDNFPFHEFNVQPEAVFAQQELGVFNNASKFDDFLFVAHDVGNEIAEFVQAIDLVKLASQKKYKERSAPLRIVKTKIYIGKEQWDDFLLLKKLFRSTIRITQSQGGDIKKANLFSIMGQTQLRLQDEVNQDELSRREADLIRREEEHKIYVETSKRDIANVQQKLDEVQQTLIINTKKLESMMFDNTKK